MKIGILFSGYGNQFVGMGKDLYDESRLVQEHFEQASSCLDINFVKLCFASSDADLAHVSNAYVALLLLNISLYTVLKESGVEPHLLAGHGVGEYAALWAAKSINLPDALYFLNKFATFYAEEIEKNSFGLLNVIGADDALLEELCAKVSTEKDFVTITIHNDLEDHVVAGTRIGVEAFRLACTDHEGVECKDLDEGFGIHSKGMDEVQEKLKMYLPKIDFHNLETPMITCVDGVQIVSSEPAKMSLFRQINNPILWSQVLANFVGCDVIITIGPKDDLVPLVQKRYPEKKIFKLCSLADLEVIKEHLKSTTELEESSDEEK